MSIGVFEESICFESENTQVVVDRRRRRITKNGEDIKLTKIEYRLLEFLVNNRGTSWNLVDLYENVWMEKFLPSSSNTVMVHILRLRKKIENDPKMPEIIKTIYGKGYIIEAA